MYLYHAFILNMFFKKLFFFFCCYSISSLSDIIETKTHGFVVFQIFIHCLLPLSLKCAILDLESSSLFHHPCIFLKLNYFLFIVCFLFSAMRPLSMSYSFDLSGKKKKKKHFTPDVVLWFLWKHFIHLLVQTCQRRKLKGFF